MVGGHLALSWPLAARPPFLTRDALRRRRSFILPSFAIARVAYRRASGCLCAQKGNGDRGLV